MARITDYPALTAPQPDDLLPVVDVHDFTQAFTGSTKKISIGNLLTVMGGTGLLPSGDTTGAADTAAIQGLLTSAAPGSWVRLAAGVFYTNAPLIMHPGVRLSGTKGATYGTGDQPNNIEPGATTLKGSASFAQGSSPVKAMVVFPDCPTLGIGGSSGAAGMWLDNLWIDGQNLPAAVDGVSLYGHNNAGFMSHVGIYKVTGNGLSEVANGATTPSGSDGFHAEWCIITNCGLHGVYGPSGGFTDGSFLAVHSESNGTTGTGDGFYMTFANVRLTHCKSSINQNGYTIDAFGTGSVNPIGGAEGIKLNGCSSDGNRLNGLNIINSSVAGTTSRAPVFVSNFSSSGDGKGTGAGGNGSAGIYIAGRNAVWLSNTMTVGSTDGAGNMFPDYGLHLATAGTGPGAADIVAVSGGLFNGKLAGNVAGTGATTTSIQVDASAAPAHGLVIGYGVYGYAGSVYREVAGSANLVPLAVGT